MKRLLVDLDPSAPASDGDVIVALLRQLPAVLWVSSVELTPEEACPVALDQSQRDPGDLTLTIRDRRYLKLRDLGVCLAQLSDQQAALLQALLEAGRCFTSAKELHAYLRQRDREAWEGREESVRSVYARLRQKLAGTHYELAGEGAYGFVYHLRKRR